MEKAKHIFYIILDCERLEAKRGALYGCQQPGRESDTSRL